MTHPVRRAAAFALALGLAACASRPAPAGARASAPPRVAAPVATPVAHAAPVHVVAAAPAAASAPVPVAGPIPFDARDQTLEAALAAGHGKPVAMYFLASWCGFCRKMESQTLTDRGVQAAMADWYDVFVDPDSPVGRTLSSRYTTGAYPTTVLFDAHGNAKQRLVGVRDPAELAATLRANR